MTALNTAVSKAKKDGSFDEGVADLKATSFRCDDEPTDLHIDRMTNAKTKLYVVPIPTFSYPPC